MATLILEDGTRYEGTLFGHKAPVTGEVVFTTGMTGYQETLTDPSYCGQIVCMTYPLIGNVGINDIDNESAGVRMRGLIVSELCDVPSNWQMKKTLDQYLNEQGVTGLYGVDTRALTRHVREFGTLRGRIVEGEPTEEDIVLAKNHEMHDQVAQCTCKEAYDIQGEGKYNIAVMDFGLKRGILRSLLSRGCTLRVFPADTDAQTILDSGCDGVMLTNGPGDPQDNPKAIATIRRADGQKADVRHLPGSSADGAGDGRTHGSNEIRSSWRKPSGQGFESRHMLCYGAEPWLHGRSRASAGGRGRQPCQLERSDG